MPMDYDPGVDFFYNNFTKKFIPDMIRLMAAGINIDADAVEELRKTIDVVLESVRVRLADNPIITKYCESRLPAAQKAHETKSTEKVRTPEHYICDFNRKDILHRTWVINHFLTLENLEKDCKEKWTIANVKRYNVWANKHFLTRIVENDVSPVSRTAVAAMKKLAEYKAEIWNKPRYEKAGQTVPVETFNPGSSKQKKELFEMLGIKAIAFSKETGEASWGREEIQQVLYDNPDPTKEIFPLLEALIDHSYSAIIKNNFIKGFDSFTIDGVLHGSIKLFGAKSFRNTSNSPNLLNMPSSKSIYAKPLKRCFVAPEGYLIYTADLGALEDRVIANLSGDTNKQNIFKEGLDGHSLNACGYFSQEIAKVMGENTDNIAYIKEFYRLADEMKHEVLSKIRFNSKAPTFKLAYGGFPDFHKGGVITQEIFDRYHNVLYPGIRDYTYKYVLERTKADGYIHLGLGCRMYSSNPEDDIRTLNNATVQFWSIITLIAVNELNYMIDQAGYADKVEVISSIYDSIYVKVVQEPEVMKWLNDTLIPIMCVQYLEDEEIHNTAGGEFGLNWADLHKVSNNASIEEIEKVLKEIHNDYN
jgi:hypothetical protein